MKKLRLTLVALIIGLMLPLGVFAQKGNKNSPPKEKERIVDKEKKEKPPPRNSNRGRPE